MQPILTCSVPAPAAGWRLSAVMEAMQQAATAHSVDLMVDYHRMLADFGALWMIARCRVTLSRLPEGPLQVHTCLRPPRAAVSNRDFTLEDGRGPVGTAVQGWVLVDAATRKLLPMKQVAPMLAVPVASDRREEPKHLPAPEGLTFLGSHTIAPEEIDANGHLNNVRYIAYAEAAAPEDWLCLDVFFDRECFAGETLTLEAARVPGGLYLRGRKQTGEESFRLRFGKEPVL